MELGDGRDEAVDAVDRDELGVAEAGAEEVAIELALITAQEPEVRGRTGVDLLGRQQVGQRGLGGAVAEDEAP